MLVASDPTAEVEVRLDLHSNFMPGGLVLPGHPRFRPRHPPEE